MTVRRLAGFAGAVLLSWVTAAGAVAAAEPTLVLKNWYTLMLELVRHTATYSPPAAARTFGYVGVTAFEATASGSDTLVTLAGQLNELTAVPQREDGATYDEGVILNTALSDTIAYYFSNTGPTGLRSVATAQEKWRALAVDGVPEDVVARSEGYGHAVSAHIIEWSLTDGGAAIENMGFPLRVRAAGWRRQMGADQRDPPAAASRCCPSGATTAPSRCRRVRPARRPARRSSAPTRRRNSTRKPTRSTRRERTRPPSRRPSRASGRTIRCSR